MTLDRYVRWPPSNRLAFALGLLLWVALAASLVARAGDLDALTLAAAGLFLVLGAVDLAFGLSRLAASMGSFGLAQTLWNVPVGPRVSYMSALSATLLVLGLAALLASVRADEITRLDDRLADS